MRTLATYHMITHHYPFEQAIEAFELTEKDPEQVCKMMLHFEAW